MRGGSADEEVIESMAVASTKSEIVLNLPDSWFGPDGVHRETYTSDEDIRDLLTGIRNNSYVYIDGAENTELKSSLTYKLQKKDGNTYSDVDIPSGAGEYKYIISLEEVEGLADAATKEVELVYNKIKIGVDATTLPYEINAGDSIAEFIEKVKEEYWLVDIPFGAKDAFITSATVTVVTPKDMKPVTDTVFDFNKDYAYKLELTLADDKTDNYELVQPELVSLIYNEKINTKIDIDCKDPLSAEYTGSGIQMPATGYTVKVLFGNGSTPEVFPSENVVEYTDKNISKTWLDADKQPITGNPVNAGRYFIKIEYNDPSGRYAGSEAYIPFDINQVSIYIKPSLTPTTYTDAMKIGDVLKKVSYDVFDSKTNAKKSIDKSKFFGVTYNDGQDGNMQPYEPYFVIQQKEAVKDSDDNPVKDENGKIVYSAWSDVEDDDIENINFEATELVKYRLVFSGKKISRDIARNIYDFDKIVDINAGHTNTADTNYVVDVSEATIDEYAIDLTINPAKPVVIDISSYDRDAKEKIFDEKPLYETRAAYKKAVAKNNDKTVNKGMLSYTWYVASEGTPKKDEEGNDILDDEGNPVLEYNPSGSPICTYAVTYPDGTKEGISPKSATPGRYVLAIEYDDETGEYAPAYNQIVYTITKQHVQPEITVPKETHANGLSISGNGIDRSYVYMINGSSTSWSSVYNYPIREDLEKAVKPIINNDWDENYLGKQLGNDLKWAEDDYVSYGDYYLKLNRVERKNKVTGEWEIIDPSQYDSCKPDEAYRLNTYVSLIDASDNKFPKDNDYAGYETVEDAQHNHYSNWIYVNTEKMGNIPVDFEIDQSKFTFEKKYDGQPIVIPKDAITLVRADDRTPITDAEYSYYTYFDDKTLDDYYYDYRGINAGTYTLNITYPGDKKYASKYYSSYSPDYNIPNFYITKREITAKPVLVKNPIAGNARYMVDPSNIEFGGDILESEKKAFKFNTFIDKELQYKNQNNANKVDQYREGYEAVEYYDYPDQLFMDFDVYDSDGNKLESPNRICHSGQEYSFYLNSVILRQTPSAGYSDSYYNFKRNYNVTFEPAKVTPEKGNSVVENLDYNDDGIGEVSIKDYVTGMKHSIVTREGIPFVSKDDSPFKDENGNKLPGYWVALDIFAPDEFYDENGYYFSGMAPVLLNSVKNAGGIVLDNGYEHKDGDVYLAFDASDKKNKSFEIQWAEGHTEQFVLNFASAVLEEDLTKAVAPKKLAITGYNKTMAVGETQQIDVTITKVRPDDVNLLVYESLNKSILNVTETGFVTALKTGKAKVKVTPSYMDKNGNVVPVPKAKAVTADITVKNVTAPKISKIVTEDDKIEVIYSNVNDGYRREFYIIKGKNIKASEFESKIKNVKNGDYVAAGFVYDPFIVSADYAYGDSTKLSHISFDNLEPNTQYTVYVRNVSGIRTLGDGSEVAYSAVGNVKTVKTRLSQVKGLELSIPENYRRYDSVDSIYYYEIPLAQKSVKLTIKGWFFERFFKKDAEYNDSLQLVLPFGSQYKKTYEQPSLAYYVITDGEQDSDGVYFDPTYEDDWKDITKRYKASKIAKVDKKGNLIPLGRGDAWVLVCDKNTGMYVYQKVRITATPDKMTVAKSLKLKTGDVKWLSDIATFYVGKKKLVGCIPYSLTYTIVSGDKDAFYFEQFDNNVVVIPKKSNAKITVKVEDLVLKNNRPAYCGGTVTISTGALEPVKNLKVSNIVDRYATLTFDYPKDYLKAYEYEDDSNTIKPDQLYFRIRLQDSSKRVWYDNYVPYGSFHPVTYKGDMAKFTYTLGTGDIKNLTRKSGYTVSVTASYLTDNAKTVSKSFKTTDIPAVYPVEYYTGSEAFTIDPDEGETEKNVINRGIPIYVDESNVELSYNPVFTSNNKYTLVTYPVNMEARNRLTDTLIWKSSNTKVATVKANAGSYTATLSAKREGVTNIEVKSKITKRVIARWQIHVNATGDAGYYFYDTLEPDDEDIDGYLDSLLEEELDIVTLDNKINVKIPYGKIKVVKFIAPEYGYYSVEGRDYTEDEYGELVPWSGGLLKKGQSVYSVWINNQYTSGRIVTVSASGTAYKELTMAGMSYSGTETTYVAFTAQEDNVYTFVRKNGDTSADLDVYNESNIYSSIGSGSVRLEKGRTYLVKLPYIFASGYDVVVTKREFNDLTVGTALSNQKFTKSDEVWYSFTPNKNGLYDFILDDSVNFSDLDINKYEGATSTSGTPVGFATGNYFEEGKTYYISVVASVGASEDEITTSFKISPEYLYASDLSASGLKYTVSGAMASGDEKVISFKVAADGRYRFSTKGVNKDDATDEITTSIVSIYSVNPDGSKTPISPGDVLLYKDMELIITVRADGDDCKLTLNVDPITVKKLALGTNATCSVKQGEDTYFVFNSTETGDYTFLIYGNAKGENPAPVFTSTSGINEMTLEIPAGESKEIVLNGTTAAEGDTATIIIHKAPEKKFGTSTTISLKKGEYVWLEWDSPEPGSQYKFTDKVTQEGKSVKINISSSPNYSKNFSELKGDATESSVDGMTTTDSKYGFLVWADTDDVTYTIKAEKITAEKFVSGNISIPANSERTFYYTANELNAYLLNVEGEDFGTSVKIYDSNSDEITDNPKWIDLGSGERYIIKFVNTSDEAKTVKATITKVFVPVEISADETKTAKLKADVRGISNALYTFTAPETGFYSITNKVTVAEGATYSFNHGVNADLYSVRSFDPNIMGVISVDNNNALYMKKGNVIYLINSFNSIEGADDATVATTVNKITANNVSFPEGKYEIKKDKKDVKNDFALYKVNGKGEFHYVVENAEDSSDYSSGHVKVGYAVYPHSDTGLSAIYPYNDVDVTINYSSTTATDYDNEFFYVLVATGGNDKISYNLTLSRKNYKELSLGTASLSLKQGETTNLEFAAPEAGWYELMLTGVPEDQKAKLVQPSSVYSNVYDNEEYLLCYLPKDYKVCPTVKIDDASETLSCKISVKAITASAMTSMTSGKAEVKADGARKNYKVKWFRYNVDDGVYVLNTNTTSNYKIYDFDYSNGKLTQTFNTITSKNTDIEKKYSAGTRAFAIFYTDTVDSDIVFTIKKRTATTLTVGADAKEVTLGDDWNSSRVYYFKYKAPSDGEYRIVCDMSVDDAYKFASAEDFNEKLFTSSGEYNSYINGTSTETLTKGSEVIFGMRKNTKPGDTFTIKVEKVEETP